eukprot:TRINITY_DN112026_c0_g1_i1.p2 TRINITY_DN112026_c0_g1~~TRINITY_DN112026_c0_g1_i1.p2  ORF type:complete len:173 (-),score=34.35 TRINITY_DN112026_c0_g1_i1:67-585(-)
MAAVMVAGGYHGPPPRSVREEGEELEPGSLEWLLSQAEVSWREPTIQAATDLKPKVNREDLDRMVRQQMVECLSERVNLNKRVEVVHKGGSPEYEESCSAASRALWAGPLLTCARGIRSVSRPIKGCCADTMEMCGGRNPEGIPQPRDAPQAPAEAELWAKPWWSWFAAADA